MNAAPRTQPGTTQNEAPEFVRHWAFSKPWRPYQQRAIDAFDRHVADGHFHLIAAPGSGKTVMGLEVVRHLARPALVLAPTLAIREQWVTRLIDDFLPPGFDEIFWLSRNLEAPRELTVSTYQALGTAFRRDGGEALLARLADADVSVLVVDEAHHLRAFWWKCLQTLKERLDGATVVALTATPPVDVPQAEWNRYSTFCGPIDEEVGVPELVAENNLCPHQDHVHFSLPVDSEAEALEKFERGVSQLILDLQLDTDFAARLSAFPHWVPATPSRDFLRDQQEFHLALAIFLIKTAGRLPEALRRHYPFTGLDLPELDPLWMQALLQGLLFDFRPALAKICDPLLQADLKRWEARVRAIGGIEKSRVALVNTRHNDKILRHSPAKIDSIAAIVEHESQAMGLGLRAVVLADYIRREAFPTGLADAAEAPREKLGVVPLFERIRRMSLPDVHPAILTGSLIVVPEPAVAALRDTLGVAGADVGNFRATPLPHAPGHCEIGVREADRQKAVAAVTERFRHGDFNCLVGTASLLGEGWDAPALNTLVLASVVGSFVMSNQMRGRAIRVDPADPDKAANIWHLATLAPRAPETDPGGSDFAKLRRRFEAFHGIGIAEDDDDGSESEQGTRIENGLERLGCDPPPAPDPGSVERANAAAFRRAEDRFAMRRLWKTAIAPRLEGRFLRPVRTLTTPAAMVRIRFSAWLGQRETGLRARIRRWMQLRRLRRTAEAILEGMAELGEFGGLVPESAGRLLRLDHSGESIRVSLPGLPEETQACLVRSLAEFHDLFDNPRYLLRTARGWQAVPEIFATRKKRAVAFSRRMRRAIGRHELVYAHGSEGLGAMLDARQQGLLRHREFRTEVRVCWEAEEADGGASGEE